MKKAFRKYQRWAAFSGIAQQSRWLVAAIICCVGFTATVRAGELDTYEYKLVISKDDKVCKHMEQLYNTHFKRPHDVEKINRIEQLNIDIPPLGKDKLGLWKLKRSFYPTSPEFEAVRWRYKTYESDKSMMPMILTEVDINNDGVDDVVMKKSFLSGPRGMETLTIFPKDGLDINKLSYSLRELAIGHEGKTKPRHLETWSAINRLFRYGDITFIHQYRFCPGPGDSESCGIFDPPERIRILKYIKGGQTLPEFVPVSLIEVCEFTMTVSTTKQ